MDAENTTMPSSAMIVAVIVLVYSVLCFSFGILLLLVLYLSREKFSYVFLFAFSTTCSTSVNIIQQIYYIVNWHELRKEQYEAALAAYDKPTLALGPLSKGFNEVLFWVVLYFYNVDCMLMLFWAMSLFFGVLSWRPECLHSCKSWIGAASKIAAYVLPAFVVGFRKLYQLHLTFVPAVILLNILMLCSFAIGILCTIFVFIKYLQSQLGTGSYGPGTGAVLPGTSHTRETRTNWKTNIDFWLVIRFALAFIAMCALEVFLIFFEIRRYDNVQKVNEFKAPNFGAKATIADILNYIPGATASLLAFLLFGTTRSLRPVYASILGTIAHPFKRRARPSSRIEHTEHWAHMAEDIERKEHKCIIVPTAGTFIKGTSVIVPAVGRYAASSKELERQMPRR